MWTRVDLKKNAKIAFRRNYWWCVAVCVIVALLGGEIYGGASFDFNLNSEEQTIQGNMGYEAMYDMLPYLMIFMVIMMIALVIALCVSILVGNVMTVGGCRYFMENREHQTPVSQAFYGFMNGRYGNVVVVMLLRTLYIMGWTLLFIIPGIVKSYSYMMVPYILSENPDMDRRRAFELSQSMMDGHKMDAFVLGLSFFGWIFLGGLTWGLLNIFYVSPYMTATYAEFYAAVKAEAIYKGITSETELPGFRGDAVTVEPMETM